MVFRDTAAAYVTSQVAYMAASDVRYFYYVVKQLTVVAGLHVV